MLLVPELTRLLHRITSVETAAGKAYGKRQFKIGSNSNCILVGEEHTLHGAARGNLERYFYDVMLE